MANVTNEVNFRTNIDGSNEDIINPDKDLEGQKPKNLIPVAIVLPETLMNSFSFRSAFFEYSGKSSINEIAPQGERNSSNYRQSASSRDLLYNNFFNASDRSFADANSNWTLSANTNFEFIYLGYNWGVFLPIGKSHRFFKTALGLSIVHSKVSITLYLYEEYKISKSEGDGESKKTGECIGKKEIDEGKSTDIGLEPLISLNLWERYTEDSILNILTFSTNLDTRKLNIKYKNHNNTPFSSNTRTQALEIISYTYRF